LFAAGWDGDRYQVVSGGGEGEREGEALVWYSVWDDARAADRFAGGLERAWAKWRSGDPKGLPDGRRRWEVKRLAIEGRPGVRLVDAPANWEGWRNVPRVRVLQ
jgi:hypothetical protein